jgi:hypothetical protein
VQFQNTGPWLRRRRFGPFGQIDLWHWRLLAALLTLKAAISTAAAISARPSIHVPSAAAIESSAAATAAFVTLLSHCLVHLKEIFRSRHGRADHWTLPIQCASLGRNQS